MFAHSDVDMIDTQHAVRLALNSVLHSPCALTNAINNATTTIMCWLNFCATPPQTSLRGVREKPCDEN
jgi:hypothetical protein